MSDKAEKPAPLWGYVRNPQDFIGGLALIGLALVALWASSELPGMHTFAFGPGTAPRLFAVLLAVMGGVVAALGVIFEGPHVERYRLRGPLFITASILLFAATIRPLGLVISSFATILICAAAAGDIRWRETVIVAAALTVFCAILFPYILNLPMQLWPPFLRY